MISARLGQNIRKARGEAGISQEDLAFAAGLHRTEVGLIERGGRVPRIDTLLKLATALGVKIESPLLDGIAWRAGRFEAGGFEVHEGRE